MSELPHYFKLKVTKGDQTVEVEIGGAEKFVAPGYQDVKSAALTFLRREAANGTLPNQPGAVPLYLESTSVPSQEATSSATPTNPATAKTPPPVPQSSKKSKKPYAPKTDEKAARQVDLEKIRTGTFDGIDRYTAAIQSGENPSDRAALVTDMALEKFGIDGLSPAEVCWLLAEKFKVGQHRRPLEEAMKAQPTSFYLVAAASHDKRQKLYRPVSGCTKHVHELLKNHDGLRAPSNGNGGVPA